MLGRLIVWNSLNYRQLATRFARGSLCCTYCCDGEIDVWTLAEVQIPRYSQHPENRNAIMTGMKTFLISMQGPPFLSSAIPLDFENAGGTA